jgi:NADH-quinone oxidoreductase subunit N
VASPAEVSLALIYLALASSLAVPLVQAWERWGAGAAARLLAIAGTAAATSSALLLLYATQSGPVYLHEGLVSHNAFTSAMLLLAGLAGLFVLWASGEEPSRWPTHPAFYGLVPLTLFGLYYMAGAADALVFLAAWLLVSVASYVITASPGDKESRAAAARYVLMGSLATLFLAVWLALHAGLVSVESLENWLALTPYTAGGLTVVAGAFLLSGLGFKLGVVPFHWWLPSVYARADGRVVGFVAAAAKLGFIAFLARYIHASATPQLAPFLGVLAVVTMTYGNVAALTSRDLRVILAYSSIAHVGYILAALAALAYVKSSDPTAAALALGAVAVHAAAYALAKSTLFPLAAESGGSLEGLKGLARRDPHSAVSAGILLLSLLGVPPLLGFWGKLFIILAAIKYSLPLVVAVVVNSGISAVYYVTALREMWSPEGEPRIPSQSLRGALVATAIATLALGFLALALLPAFTP